MKEGEKEGQEGSYSIPTHNEHARKLVVPPNTGLIGTSSSNL